MKGCFFVVPGDPEPWRRARSRGKVRFTDPRSVAFKAKVALFATRACKVPIEGPVCLRVACYWPARKPDLKTPRPPEWRDTRPDADNVLKAVADALNGIAYVDDAQVVVATVLKGRTSQGKGARIEVSVMPAPRIEAVRLEDLA